MFKLNPFRRSKTLGLDDLVVSNGFHPNLVIGCLVTSVDRDSFAPVTFAAAAAKALWEAPGTEWADETPFDEAWESLLDVLRKAGAEGTHAKTASCGPAPFSVVLKGDAVVLKRLTPEEAKQLNIPGW